MHRRTLKYGLCPLSTSGFSALSLVRCAMNNFQGGKRLADQAISLLNEFDSNSQLSRTYFISYFMVKSWTMPYVSCLKFLQEGYQVGLQCGDTDSSSWNIA